MSASWRNPSGGEKRTGLPPFAGICSKCRVAPCTIPRVRGSCGALGCWISANIGPESTRSGCEDRLPTFVRRRPSHGPVWSRFRTTRRFPDLGLTTVCARWSGSATRPAVPTSKGRRTTIAGALRILWANPGGDPSTMRPTRHPNSRDGARRDAAFEQIRNPHSRFAQTFWLKSILCFH